MQGLPLGDSKQAFWQVPHLGCSSKSKPRLRPICIIWALFCFLLCFPYSFTWGGFYHVMPLMYMSLLSWAYPRKPRNFWGKQKGNTFWLLCTGMQFLLISFLKYRDLHGVYYTHFVGMDQDSEGLTVTEHVSYRSGAQIQANSKGLIFPKSLLTFLCPCIFYSRTTIHPFSPLYP